jgi:hypothetical protein
MDIEEIKRRLKILWERYLAMPGVDEQVGGKEEKGSE